MGRFQPITKAHYSMIKDAIRKYDEVYVIVIVSKASIAANSRRRLRVSGRDISKEGDLESWKKRRSANRLSKSYSYKKLGSDEQKSNPFSGRYRKLLIHKSMKGQLEESNILSYTNADIIEITKKVKSINNDDTFYFLAGSDRVEQYNRMIEDAKERDQFDPDIRVRVEEIKRDMESADTVKATKVRNSIINNDIETFKSLVPKGIHDEFERMRHNLITESNFSGRLLKEMTHIEDLKIDEFIEFVENIYKSEASIKLDGTTALGFGFDDQGFFTGFGRDFKSIKPEKRKRSVQDWLSERSIVMNAPVSAHKLIEDNMDKFEGMIGEGEIVLAEVLFGDKPNSIKYDFGGINHLVILNNNQVGNALSGKYDQVVSNFIIEGEDKVVEKEVRQSWKVGITPTIDSSKYEINISAELQELKNFLNSETEGMKNFDILGMRAVGGNKELVYQVREQAKSLKLNIKERLLRDFVRQVKGGDYSPSEGFSHEGIVLKRGNKRTKIIDKSVFTSAHERDWAPIKAVDKIKKEMSKDDAIKEIGKMIRNFDKLYPEIDDITKQRMINSLKMVRIQMREL